MRLGFGSAGIPGGSPRADSIALIEAAVAAGIRHFDTARMYGAGAAESVLGDAAAHHRNAMIIVTKAGIAPSTQFARAAAKLTAGIVTLPGARPRFGRFSAAQVKASFEQSLKALGADFVDALLLHEVAAGDITDDLLRALQDLQREGQVGLTGVATSIAETTKVIALHPDLCQVVQAPLAWLDANCALPSDATLVIHSVFGPEFAALRDRLANRETAALFQAATGRDAGDEDAVGHLWLQAARARNPDGVTLFSSSRVARVRANAALPAADAGAALAALRAFEATMLERDAATG